ncbi:MAG: hypothetical protein ACTHOP_25170 [Mesorhizobium sp.]
MKICATTVPSIHLARARSEDESAHLTIHVDLTIEDDHGQRTGTKLAVVVPYDPKATIAELISKGIEGARAQYATAAALPLNEWERLQRESLEHQRLVF